MTFYFNTHEYNVNILKKIQNEIPKCNDTEPCHDNNAECDYTNSCKCNKEYEYKLVDDKMICVPCPGYNFPCKSCCEPGLICTDDICHPPQGGVFVTASQIALSAALIMGIAALAMVIYRLCTKPKYQTARQRAERRIMDRDSINTGAVGNIRASLSSIQIRILNRLRDRPPPYQNEQTPSTIEPNIIGQNAENPPPYNCSRDLESHLPPPYTEVVLSPSEYVNQSFENTEESTNSINISNENRTVNKSMPNDTTSTEKNTDK